MTKIPKLKINAKEHFWVQGLKRGFDLSGIVPLYLEISSNLANIERNKNLELCIGRATLIYSVDDKDTIHLISGWSGNRKKVAA